MPVSSLRIRQQGFSPRLARGLVGNNRRYDGHARVDLKVVLPVHGVRGLEHSIRRFAGMKPVRETLLGMVDAVSDAKWRA